MLTFARKPHYIKVKLDVIRLKMKQGHRVCESENIKRSKKINSLVINVFFLFHSVKQERYEHSSIVCTINCLATCLLLFAFCGVLCVAVIFVGKKFEREAFKRFQYQVDVLLQSPIWKNTEKYNKSESLQLSVFLCTFVTE